jgi:cation diffusion facilitator CzcD-associated flavoprotein CzcO
MSRSKVDVVIVGAGPYGLSLASYLSDSGVERRIFGVPMRAWRDMPPGMNLKSFGFATSIPSLRPHFTFPEYCRARGLEDFEPISFTTFSEYGEWFQQQLVPDVETTLVSNIDRQGDAFEVTLNSGEVLQARRIIVAAGLSYFTRTPDMLKALPAGFVTHTSKYVANGQYAGRDIAVIGAGQTALEAAALLHEGGARVQILARRDVWWSDRFKERSLRNKLLNPNTVVGPGRKNWVLQHLPWLPYYLPTERRVRLARTYLGPLGAWWLRPRVDGKVPIERQVTLLSAAIENNQVALRFRAGQDEKLIRADHIISATGYEADVDRLTFLSPKLAADVKRIERAPELSPSFESSVAGLYFVGPVAAFSFGPLVRFVAGATFTVPRVSRHVVKSLKRQPAPAPTQVAGAKVSASSR